MGKTAVVTGASTGIGAAFARALAARGYDLVLVARDRTRLEDLASELRATKGIAAEAFPADLTSDQDLLRVEAKVRETASLALLVNNAGFGTKGRFADSDLAAEDREIRLNVLALVRLTHAALGPLAARGEGGIVNVSSAQAFFPSPYVATYGATKAFVNSFTESIASEMKDTGVKVQVLCPGFTRTEFQDRAGMNTSSIPSGAWMTPESVVHASLAALDRGELVCVPGAQNQALVASSKVVPGGILRAITSKLNRRVV